VFVYWLANFNAALTILIALYAIDVLGVKRSLAAVSDGLVDGDNHDTSVGVEAATTLGWPYRGVGPMDWQEAVFGQSTTYRQLARPSSDRWRFLPPVVQRALLSGLVGWWLYVITYWYQSVDPVSSPDLGFKFAVVTFCFLMVVPVSRWLIYCAAHRPPISLWGRIRTGQWIIPGHDQVYIAPLATPLIGLACVWLPVTLGVSPLVATPATVATVLWLNLVLGPSLRDWHLTGNHRLAPEAFNPRTPTRQTHR
jgi:hypothetical protein